MSYKRGSVPSDYKELYISFPLRIGKKLLLAKFAPIKKLVLK
ncbi:hypothetical protein [Brevibacillus laterosporus]